MEGTNLSEGRGTTTPFELWGSPYLKNELVLEYLADAELPGLVLRPARFQPSFDKWRGQICSGFQIHVSDPEAYRQEQIARRLPDDSLTLIQAVLATHPEEFSWSPPPYEYEFRRLPIEIILGSADVHRQLEAGAVVSDLEQSWQPQLRDFRELCAPYLLYA